MGLLAKLFGKKETKPKQEEAKKEERITFDSPHGTFYYINNPNEIGYECDTDWYPNRSNMDSVGAYIDTDTPETTEAKQCYAKLEALFADKERIDYEVKRLAVEHLMSKPELVWVSRSLEEQIADTNLIDISVYRNGDVTFLLDITWTEANFIIVHFKADGSKEITYETGQRETFKKHCEKL